MRYRTKSVWCWVCVLDRGYLNDKTFSGNRIKIMDVSRVKSYRKENENFLYKNYENSIEVNFH